MTELWKIIDGWNNRYEISNLGRVKNGNTFLKPQKSSNNYLCVYLRNPGGVRKCYRIHRLVGEYFILNDNNEKTHINHIDGNKENNIHTNLEWVTPKENSLHAVNNHLFKKGGKHLNKELIISDYTSNNLSHKQMAQKYDCSIRTIERILSGHKKP